MSVKLLRSVLVLAALLLPLTARAQGTGTIAGTVKDSSGGAIPGATIRVVNESTSSATEAVSGDGGVYRVEGLAPGALPRGGRPRRLRDGDRARSCCRPARRSTIDVTLSPARFSQSVVVTARRVEEVAQEVPIPVSVVRGDLVADAGAFNVNRLKEMLPTVQFYSTNPRNSAINIRGLGAPFGLTNDGIEPGVGLYIDGVFYARPASATLDFLDVEQVEVLRGPQGTLFGKNTTAGAINVTTRKPSFTPGSDVELNYGNFGFVQAKASVTGPARQERRRTPVVLRHAARRRAPQHAHRRRRERPQQPRRPRPDAVRAVRRARGHAGRSTTRASGRRATRRSSPASRRRCARRTGSTRRSPPTSATRRPASTPSTA